MVNALEVAIMRTVLYADVFKFALTYDELHRYLISDSPVTSTDIKTALQESDMLQENLHQETPYICLNSRKAIIEVRKERERITGKLRDSGISFGKLLSHIPFVRMVVLTGALAVRNPSSYDDDFDYLLVTKAGRVWIARAFAILLVRIVKLTGRELCPNYVLAEDNLTQSRQDLYIAHEIAQMYPIYGTDIYQDMLIQNTWIQDYLANVSPFDTRPDTSRRLRAVLEWLLGGWIGDKLEAWEYHRKLEKFKPDIQQTHSNAEINQHSVKGHFEDHGMPVLGRYEALLREYGLSENEEAMAGD